MAGGGGDPSPPPAANGGEFLLSLLQKKPHHHFHQQQQQQVLSFDPAVAAMGPTLAAFSGEPWLSNSATDLWSPHPYPPHLLGFQQQRINRLDNNFQPNQFRGGSGEDFRRSGVDGVGGSAIQNLLHQKPPSQSLEPQLMFGSLPCEFQNHQGFFNGNSSLDNNGILDPRVNSNSSASNPSRLGIYDSPREQLELRGGGLGPQHHTPVTQTRLPPPGFPSKPVGGGIWNTVDRSHGLQDNVEREKGSFGDLSNRVVGSISGAEDEARRFSTVECRMLRSEVMAQSGLSQGRHKDHYEIVEADNEDHHQHRVRDELRKEGPLGNDRVGHEFDDLSEEIANSLILEDESNDKSGKKKPRNAREKDFRSDPRGQRLLSQRMRNFKRMMGCRNDIYKLNAPFVTIYQSLIPPEEEKAKQRQLLTLLEKLVAKEWPHARLYIYGSCANTFGVSKSDIDICLAMNDVDVNKSDVLLKLAEILQSDNLENVQALTRARVPIVKLMDPITGISCDICINNVLAVVNTKLLRDYAQIDVRLHQLAFIVKHWAKSRGVNETYQGTLSSYAYVLMSIHFLQQRRPAILPCLQEMETTYSVTVDHIRCSFFDKVEKLHDFGSRNRESIAQLVWGFFNYWAYCHDYANDVISVRTGSIISKRAKDWTRRVGNDRHLICIEDPFETSHDLGRVVDKYSIKVLREEFERAADIMQHDPNPCASLFEPYVVS